MEKNKKNEMNADGSFTSEDNFPEPEVNEPGDCIGHWDKCEECSMCEIEESCIEMTKNINGDK